KSINPDEVVAIGAAIQGAVLQGEMKDVLLLDVTPLSLGIETLGGVNTILIPKNTTIPTSKSQVFSTAADNQTSVEINVLQGERPMAADNKSLGRFILDGIPPAPRGVPQIEVTFDIDADGIINVSAKDKATNKTQSIKIEGSVGMSKEEVERMKKEAELHAEEDKKKKELIEVRNTAENLIYTSEKTMRDLGDNPDISAIKKEVEDKIAELKKVKDGEDIEEIKRKSNDLSQTVQKIGAEMYKNKTTQQGAQTEEGSGKNADGEDNDAKNKDTEEGDYKENK
ncbi:MAG TPA: molecular chaperone DnaK, partial [Candidatus Parcubacteria bacterium]|nr:molecular chaperone DnaK [Candidatus Parcubacteria bacterium]